MSRPRPTELDAGVEESSRVGQDDREEASRRAAFILGIGMESRWTYASWARIMMGFLDLKKLSYNIISRND
jgi:hypothetical protein